MLVRTQMSKNKIFAHLFQTLHDSIHDSTISTIMSCWVRWPNVEWICCRALIVCHHHHVENCVHDIFALPNNEQHFITMACTIYTIYVYSMRECMSSVTMSSEKDTIECFIAYYNNIYIHISTNHIDIIRIIQTFSQHDGSSLLHSINIHVAVSCKR